MSMVKTLIRKPIRLVLPAHRQRAIQNRLRAARMRHAPAAVVIGCGAIAPTHVNSFERSGAARVVAVSDIDPLALTRAMSWPAVKPYSDHNLMLQQHHPELASVCTWPDSHADLVSQLARSGVKGILCEKPLALRLDHLDAMLSVCREHGVRLAGGHQYRFHPNFVRAAELVASGALGRLQSVSGDIAGVLADNGSHLMDAVRFVLGDPPVRSVHCQCQRSKPTFYQGLPVEEGSSGCFVLNGGLPFTFRTGTAAEGYFAIRVVGERASLIVSPDDLSSDCDILIRPATGQERQFRYRQFRQFALWALGRQEAYFASAEPAAEAARMVIGCYESTRLGRSVSWPLENTGDVIRSLYPPAAAPAVVRPASTVSPLSASGAASGSPLAIHGGPRAMTGWFPTSATVGFGEIVELAKVIMGRNMNCVGGRQSKLLRQEFARAYDAPCAVPSSSGTAAIHVALGAINPEPGDEVITTPITDMGSIIPILQCNCIPVFADVDPRTGNLTAASIAARITPRTRAVILVHLFGQPADLKPICEMLAGKGIALIEDCAQAHFAQYRGRMVGTFGDFGCFSFQQSKQMTCGDGGITLVNREEFVERAELFVDKGWSRQYGRRHLLLGMNYRMTELQAAVARRQLARLDGFVRSRRAVARMLNLGLQGVEGIHAPWEATVSLPSWWIYAFSIDEQLLGVTSDEFCAALQFEGVHVNRRYLDVPVFELEVLKEQNTYGNSHYPYSIRPDCRPPRLQDYPGLLAFHHRKMTIPLSNRAQPRHAEQIAGAVLKVAAYCRGWGGTKAGSTA